MQWLNPPPAWRSEGDRIFVTTGDKTDFWRVTHYGYVRDDGHFLHESQSGDFDAEVTIRGDYRALYDQAGLMVRADAENWIKAGVEFTEGVPHLSVVVTRGVSDWSVIPVRGPAGSVRLRFSRRKDAVEAHFQLPGEPWFMARLAPFPPGPIEVGVMACSPTRAGFEVEFEGFKVGPAV